MSDPICPECNEEYPYNPYQSERLYKRAGVMLCSSRCTASFDARMAERQAA